MYPDLRNRFWQLIDSFNNPMVFTSHEHYYTRRHIDSSFNETLEGVNYKYTQTIYQITAASMGSPLYKASKDERNIDVPPISTFNFVVVDVDADRTHVTAYDLDGNILDEFEQLD